MLQTGMVFIWLLAEQHSSTVREIKCPGSTLLVDTLTRSINWLSLGDLEVALKTFVTKRWPILVVQGLSLPDENWKGFVTLCLYYNYAVQPISSYRFIAKNFALQAAVHWAVGKDPKWPKARNSKVSNDQISVFLKQFKNTSLSTQ